MRLSVSKAGYCDTHRPRADQTVMRAGRTGLLVAVATVVVLALGGALAGSAAAAPLQAVEGAAFSGTFATAGCSVSATAPSIDWGDGQITNGSFGPNGEVNGQHSYAEEGTFHGVASFQDDCGPHTTPFQTHVADAAVSGSGTVFSATAGSAFSGMVGHFTDADPLGTAADYTGTINWGDGTSSAGTVAVTGGAFDASGNHTYASAGSYQVGVAFTDAGGSAVSVGSTATVTNPQAPPPAATFTLPSNRSLVGGVLAFDGSGSSAVGGISKFAWDFDGSGRFDATCPPNLPVAYKVFDTPGSHNIGLRVFDAGGQQNTFHASMTLGRLAGTRAVARRATNPALFNVSNFWCGDRASIPLGDIGFLPPLFTSDVRAVGVEVSQGVVPDPPRPSGLTIISRAVLGGRARASRTTRLALNNDEQNPRDNRISWLQKGGKTVVRVYASALLSPFGDKVPNVQMRLYGFDNGHPLPGSPLLSETGPLDVPLGPPYTTHAMRIGYDPLEGNLPAFTFTLPDSWTVGNLAMLARPVLVGSRLDRQCSTPECSLNQQAGSGDFQFNNTGLFIIRSVAMTATGDPALPTPSSIFDQAINLSPVAVLPTPYQATINIDSITNCLPSAADDCKDPNGKAAGLISKWLNDNKPFIPSLIKVITIGVHSGYSQINGSSGYPGDPGCDPLPDGALCETTDKSPVSQVDAGRPLTSVGHEMFHDLGRPHADDSSSGCLGNGEGKPDRKGHLAGIGLDRHPGSGGSPTSPYRILSPDLPGQQAEQYDLMSYCVNKYPDNNSWLSPYNWDTVASDWIFYEKRATGSSLNAIAAAAAGQALQVSGFTDGTGTHVTHIEPAGGANATASAAAAPPDSPYHAVTKNGAGRTVADTPLSVTYGHLDGLHKGDPAIPTAHFHGVVSGLGAQHLDITQSGVVVASQPRTAHRPIVRLLAPERGTIGRGPIVQVRWLATDADHDLLAAYVDYSTDGGRHWRTVYVGRSAGSVRLPSRYFTGSRNARVRVRANDGFNETAAVSGRLRAVGSPPFVTITSPRARQRVRSDASLYLRGNAFDDAFRLLASNRLRWFVGRRLLGTGNSVSATDLPPGPQRIRLVASGAGGRTGTANVAVIVTPARPFFVTFLAPARVPRGARVVLLTLATNGPAALRAGGRRVALGRRARRIPVGVTPGGGTLRIVLALSSRGGRATQTLLIAR